MNKSGIALIIGVMIPFACAVVLGMMCFSQYKNREVAILDRDAKQQTVNSKQRELEMVNIEPLMDKKIAFEDTSEEQAQFLDQLRTDAQGAGVKLVQYMNMGRILPRPDQQNQNNQPQSIYRPVASTLTVQGTYDGVRAFAYSLLRANRLMNMNGVSWKRDTDGKSTTLSFTLIRYVTAPVTTVQTTTATVAQPGAAGGA